MNKLFIEESVESLYIKEATMISEYLTEVDAPSIGDANAALNKASKEITKLLVATLALIAILTVIKNAMKTKKQNKQSGANLSNSAKREIKKKNDDIINTAGIDVMIQDLTTVAASLEHAKADAKANTKIAKETLKEREDFLKYCKDMGMNVDSPEVKKRLKSMNKDIVKAVEDEAKVINGAKRTFNAKSNQLESLIVGNGTKAQATKFMQIKSVFGN